MSELIEIESLNYSDKIGFGSMPGLSLRVDGYSYLNRKAAKILGIAHGDLLVLFNHEGSWYVGSSDLKGKGVKFTQGMFKFCDTPNVKMLFSSLEIKSKRASFLLGDQLEPFANVKALFIKPKPFNIE